MQLKSLSATNIKGRSFNHKLAAVNIIHGNNFSGKTAALAAVRLLLLGYDHKLGKTAGGIFAACGCRGGGATELAVAGELSDGQTISRSWTMKRSKISYSGPDNEFIPSVMLDPTTFFGLTGPARLNYVLSQVDLAALGLGYEALCKKLNADETLHALVNEGAFAGGEVSNKILELEQARATEEASIYEWLTAVVEAITKLRDTESKLVDTHEQTLRGLTDNKAQDGDMTAIQSVQPQINEARERHTAAVAAQATALAAVTAARVKHATAKALANTAVNEDGVRQSIAAQQERIEQAKLVPAGEQPVPYVMATIRPMDMAERQAYNGLAEKMQMANSEFQEVTRQMKQLETDLEAQKHKTTCQTCGQGIAHLQAVVIAEIQKHLTLATGKHVGKSSVLAMATGNAQAAQEALWKASEAITAWDDAKTALDAKNETARRQWQQLQNAHNAAQTQINNATAVIQRLQQQLAGNQTAREAREQLAMLETAYNVASATHQEAVAAVPPIEQQIRQLEQQQRQYVARTQTIKLADQSRANLKTASERLAVFKAALKVVAGEKERAAADAFGALLKHARRFTDGILKAPLEYRDSELGMTFDGNWVSHKVFSGFEQLAAYMGLGVALTQQHKGIRIVMADECGAADKGNKMKLTVRLLELIEQGVIDQAFLADVTADGYPEHVKLIAVDAGK